MQENNELNDIILNKSGSTNNNKKIILAVATLGVILIIVVMLMNSLTSNGTDNLPQTPIPPEPSSKVINEVSNEPLFEEVEIIEEESQENRNLDEIAARLKEESQMEVAEITTPTPVVEKRKPVAKVVSKPAVKKEDVWANVTPKKAVKQVEVTPYSKVNYYIQVGSFSKYAPNKKFLKSITNLGYKYRFHKTIKSTKTSNKVLVGPFKSSTDAKNARKVLRAKVEPGAFLVKI